MKWICLSPPLKHLPRSCVSRRESGASRPSSCRSGDSEAPVRAGTGLAAHPGATPSSTPTSTRSPTAVRVRQHQHAQHVHERLAGDRDPSAVTHVKSVWAASPGRCAWPNEISCSGPCPARQHFTLRCSVRSCPSSCSPGYCSCSCSSSDLASSPGAAINRASSSGHRASNGSCRAGGCRRRRHRAGGDVLSRGLPVHACLHGGLADATVFAHFLHQSRSQRALVAGVTRFELRVRVLAWSCALI